MRLACVDVELIKALATVVGAGAGVVAIRVYYSNSRLQRAKWLAELYQKFYERADLKDVRTALDCEMSELSAVSALLREEPGEFTDYLNFFEFVAVLGKLGQLHSQEIEYMFGYYLDCFEKCTDVRKYIADEKKGYEQLDKLLRQRAAKK
jgi:hypothetical protein